MRKPTNTKRSPQSVKTTSFFDRFKGQKVIIQSRAGTRYEGIFEGYKDGFFWLKEATIVGREFQARTEFLAVDRGQTAHLHLEPIEVVKKEA